MPQISLIRLGGVVTLFGEFFTLCLSKAAHLLLMWKIENFQNLQTKELPTNQRLSPGVS